MTDPKPAVGATGSSAAEAIPADRSSLPAPPAQPAKPGKSDAAGSAVGGAIAGAIDPIWERLEDQIAWYDRKSSEAQRWFKRLKLGELVVAASLPGLAAAEGPAAILTVLGSLVVILEGCQHLYQFQEHWITYRATCEALRHERFLFLAEAGPYSRVRNRRAALADRVESLVSQEQAKWTAGQEEAAQREVADRG